MGSPRPLTPVLLSALLWGCAGAQGHQHGTSLPPRFQGTDAVQVSVYAVSLKDGRVICSSRPRLLMRPASTMKLVPTIKQTTINVINYQNTGYVVFRRPLTSIRDDHLGRSPWMIAEDGHRG